MIVDSHCHLNYSIEGPSIDDVLKNAKDNNVSLMLNIATKSSEFDGLLEVSNNYKEVYHTLGVHPHEASEMNDDIINKIYKNSNNSKFIGIGESGLDFHYNYSDKKTQIISFEKQIEISQDLSLPIIIHMRNAEEDTLKIIKKSIKKKNFSGVIHCFTGSQKFADEMIELGFYISASGVVTFKKSDELRNIFKRIPDNKLLIETDSPYLSPEPLRGKVNQPSHIIHTIKKLAEVRHCDYYHIVNITCKNFFELFSKIKKY
jgi:TatD DNase family protein